MINRSRRDRDGRTSGQRAFHALRTVQGSVKAQAAAARVPLTQMAGARHIQAHAAVDVAEAVAAGDLSLYAALALLKLHPDRAQHAAALAQVRAAPASMPVAVALGQPARRRRRPIHRRARLGPRRPLAWRLERALDQLDNAIETVGHFVDQPDAGTADAAPKWIGRLRDQRHALVSCTRTLLGRRRL